MKQRSYASLFIFLMLGGATRAAEVWSGVVVVAEGRADGKWASPAMRLPAAGEWERWEQIEKMTRPEELRRAAIPNGIMMPDTAGRSVLAVAPHAAMEGYVVDAGAGTVDVSGAEIVDCTVRLAGGGHVLARAALLSSFEVVESAGAAPGGSIILDGCAVTGPFGGAFWSGTQRWVIRGCHFRSSQLPWVNGRSSQAPVVERCHFEDCFIPESFLLKCKDCSFAGCVIGGPESFAAAAGKAFVLTEAGAPNQLTGNRAGAIPLTVVPGTAQSRFWSAWTGAGAATSLDCRYASHQAVRPVVLGGGAAAGSPQALVKALRGRVYRRMDGAERLQFEDTLVKIMDLGETSASVPLQSSAGGKLTWTQPVREYQSENGFGRLVKAGGKLGRQGYLSPDSKILVVVEELPGSAPDPVRVFLTLPEGVAILREPVRKVVGTTWVLNGPTKEYIRFETPTQLTWLGQGNAGRGSSVWRAMKGENDLLIADWRGEPAEVNLKKGLRSLELTAGMQTWTGTLVSRDLPENFASLVAGGAAAPLVAEAAVKPAAVPGSPAAPDLPAENPFQEDPAKPAEPQPADGKSSASPALTGDALKGKTSRVNGLLVAVLEGGRTAGATSQMNAIALPSGDSSEATLTFNQKTGPMMEKALEEVQKYQTIRQGKWPSGCRIEVSFADKYTPKDGPSAAVACALLLEGLFTGSAWDNALAVTGDLNADGSVQPVGGVPAKIKGAVGRKCRLVGIPDANERAVRDYFLSEGPQSLLAINVFTMKEFDEARDLAMVVKPAGLTTALAEFDKVIQAAPAKDKAAPWLRQGAVAAQLRKVVQAAPNHLSAKLLLEYAEGRAPLMLSLTGSFEAIDREAFEVLQAIRSSQSGANLSGIRQDKLGDAVFRLRRMRTQLHPETRRLLDSMEKFSVVIRTFLANPPRTPAFINKAVEGIRDAGNTVDQQYRALRSNPEVVAELMKE